MDGMEEKTRIEYYNPYSLFISHFSLLMNYSGNIEEPLEAERLLRRNTVKYFDGH